MAIISNFELLIKRIAPLSGNGIIDAPFRRAVQGYFLHISNPNNRTVNFRIRAHYPAWTNLSPDSLIDRELVNGASNLRNHIYTYDITGGPNNAQNVFEPMRCRIIKNGSRSLITRNLSLGACQTAAFKLLPDLRSTALDLSHPRLEIRGYLEIAQLKPFFSSSPQPIDLLFTPESRGTFLDNTYPDTANTGEKLDFDQIAYSMPTSTGAASINVSKIEGSFILCDLLSLDNDSDLKLSDIIVEEPFDYEEDFQGYRYLSSKGNKQLQEITEGLMNKYKGIEIDLDTARQQLEEVLNDDMSKEIE